MSCVAHAGRLGAYASPRPRTVRPVPVAVRPRVVTARAAPDVSSETDTKTSTSSTVRVKHGWYVWRGHRVHFERGGCAPASAKKHLLFLHGFGVGSFHYEHQLDDFWDENTCVWALDFVGQGRSWPCQTLTRTYDDGTRVEDGIDTAELNTNDDVSNRAQGAPRPDYLNKENATEPGFRYSVDTWRDQVAYFLKEIVKAESGAYVAGNSLGGFVGAYLTASETVRSHEPRLVKGLVLLNATPFWGFVPASGDDNATTATNPTSVFAKFVRNITPWDGALPAPGFIKTTFKLYWNSFRSDANVKGLLSLVYADGVDRVDDALVANIIAPTDRAPALDAFCSVVWSPKSGIDFDDMLSVINKKVEHENFHVALVYGKDDPWVVPLWGQRYVLRFPNPASLFCRLSARNYSLTLRKTVYYIHQN
jgi:pimeloyl-ACP methyl ester carboxylesterase